MPALLLCVAASLLVLDRAFPPDLRRLEVVGEEVVDRQGRTLSVLPAPGGTWRLPASVGDVPPALVAMLVAAEDRRFRWHFGVDPLSLARAAAQWVRSGHVVSGGSTLTMQAVRLLEPRPRTLRSKLVEALRAMQLERRFSKDQILGIWLTLASQGGNIEGVRAGAISWFGRPAAQLTPAEAALLIAIPRRPNQLRPDRHPEAARVARDDMLLRRARAAAGAEAALTPQDLLAAAAQPVPRHRFPMPTLAPHLSRELAAARTGGDTPGLRSGRILTTLDQPLQRAVEELAENTRRNLAPHVSVALLVANLRTREVQALSGGYWGDRERAGAIDLSRAVRSPGSALKPLLYGLGFEAGFIAPGTVVADLPRRFGTYAPENFDRGFTGRVTAAEALRMSLNLPAVALLDRLGPLRFASAMKLAGAPPRLPEGADPSLPLALGGAGTTLREMGALYAALGDGGRGAALRVIPGPPLETRPVLEARAAATVAQVLVQPFPGGGLMGIAWKTGTSWGGRDAWSLGFDGAHVAAVWVGRPDGTPMPGATGRALALPILSRLFSLLPPAPLSPLPVRPRFVAGGEAPDHLRLLFPPAGAVLPGDEAVTLRVQGGRRPLHFLVDGVPIASEPARREANWTPPAAGFYRVTVLDADGVAASVPVRVRDAATVLSGDRLPEAVLRQETTR
ncbi:penicillin-binding protein 1C [Roseomonas elaeocarpi]|uniref:peptidoglycan glycosyltransferase n=1 Tax=Roseomonas elaeocarpi TaxID=907779 RepID=A0ABV6JMW7_9PROT